MKEKERSYFNCTSLKNPFVVKTASKRSSKIMFINSPQVGLLCSDDSFTNPLMNSLRLAEAEKCDAVIITGNLVFLDTKKYSPNKPYRSRIVKTELFKELLSKEEAILMENGEPIFLDYKEKFNHLVKQLKSFFVYNNAPIFNGPINIILGAIEEEIALKYANLQVMYQVMKSQKELKKEIDGLKAKIKALRKENNEDGLSEVLERLEILEKEKIKIKASYISDYYINKIAEEMRSYIAGKYEEAVPNSRVVSSGITTFKINDFFYQILHNPDFSGQDSNFGKEISNLRQSTKPNDHPDFIFIGGRSNLTYSSLPISYRSRKKEMTSVTVKQLAMLLDLNILKKYADKMIKGGDPLMNLIRRKDCSSGILIHEIVDRIPKEKHFALDCLINKNLFASKQNIHALVYDKNIFYIEREGDIHCGHPWAAYYETFQKTYYKFHHQVIHDFLLHIDAPICMYINLGDILQGHHFPSEKQKNADYEEAQEGLKKIDSLRISLDEKYELTKRNQKLQEILRGEITVGGQKEIYRKEFLELYHEYFCKVIERAKRINLITSGNLGIITILGGNHFDKTLEGEFKEGVEIAELFRDVLLSHHHNLTNLKEIVKAPIFGQISVLNGMAGIVPKGLSNKATQENLIEQENFYLYAFYGHHKPVAHSSKYKDPLKPTREAFAKRGTTEIYQQGRHTLVVWGHTHYGGMTILPSADLVGCGSQTFHDPYGEENAYPLNNIYTEITGLPKDGPAWGPRVYIQLRYEEFKEYAKNPWKVDRDKLFCNAIG